MVIWQTSGNYSEAAAAELRNLLSQPQIYYV
jgi:hypothetical protein